MAEYCFYGTEAEAGAGSYAGPFASEEACGASCPPIEPGTDCDTAPTVELGVTYGPFVADGDTGPTSHNFLFANPSGNVKVTITVHDINRQTPGSPTLGLLQTLLASGSSCAFMTNQTGDDAFTGTHCIGASLSAFHASGLFTMNAVNSSDGGNPHAYVEYSFIIEAGTC